MSRTVLAFVAFLSCAEPPSSVGTNRQALNPLVPVLSEEFIGAPPAHSLLDVVPAEADVTWTGEAFVVVFRDDRSPMPTSKSILMTAIDAAGEPHWLGRRPVAIDVPVTSRPSIATGLGTTLVVWESNTGIEGTRLLADAGVLDTPALQLRAGNSNADLVFADNQFVLVSTRGANVEAQRISLTGNAQTAVVLGAGAAPCVGFDGVSSLAVWVDAGAVHGARLSASGVPGPAFLIAAAGSAPSVSCAAGQCFVAWVYRPTASMADEVWGARVVGSMVLDPNGIRLSSGLVNGARPAVHQTASGATVAWHEEATVQAGGSLRVIGELRVASVDMAGVVSSIEVLTPTQANVTRISAATGSQRSVWVWSVASYDRLARLAARFSDEQRTFNVGRDYPLTRPFWNAVAASRDGYLVVGQTLSRGLSQQRGELRGTLFDRQGRRVAGPTMLTSQLAPDWTAGRPHDVASNGWDFELAWLSDFNEAASRIHVVEVSSTGRPGRTMLVHDREEVNLRGVPRIAASSDGYVVGWPRIRPRYALVGDAGPPIAPAESGNNLMFHIGLATAGQAVVAAECDSPVARLRWLVTDGGELSSSELFVIDGGASVCAVAASHDQVMAVRSDTAFFVSFDGGFQSAVPFSEPRMSSIETSWTGHRFLVASGRPVDLVLLSSDGGQLTIDAGLDWTSDIACHDRQCLVVSSSGRALLLADTQRPVANAQTLSTNEDTPLALTLTGSDPDGEPITWLVEPPTQGVLSGAAPSFLYTPPPDFHGAATFTFKTFDNAAQSEPATVTITVNPVNDAPLALGQQVVTDEDIAVPVTIAATDIDGPALTFSVTRQPAHGTLSGTAPTLTYTPQRDFFGQDSFSFTVSDGFATSMAQVNITVNEMNGAPLASGATFIATQNEAVAIELIATDSDGDLLTYSVTRGPDAGTLSGTAPRLSYSPRTDFVGSDSFEFVANDGRLSSPVATVSLSVMPRDAGAGAGAGGGAAGGGSAGGASGGSAGGASGGSAGGAAGGSAGGASGGSAGGASGGSAGGASGGSAGGASGGSAGGASGGSAGGATVITAAADETVGPLPPPCGCSSSSTGLALFAVAALRFRRRGCRRPEARSGGTGL